MAPGYFFPFLCLLILIAWSFMNDYKILMTGVIIGRRGRPLKPWKSKGGYLIVQLNLDGVKKPHLVHRLVATKYLPNPDNLPQVNHKDGDKLNNSVENLEWCTQSENMKHSFRMSGRTTGRSNAALTDQQVLELCELRKAGKTYYELSDVFGISYQAVHRIAVGDTYKHVKRG